MPQRELHGRRCTSGSADDGGTLDVQRVQQTSVCVGLCRRRCILRERSTQIPVPRHGDHTETSIDQSLAEVQTLIEAASGAMHHQDRRAIAGDRVLDGPHGVCAILLPLLVRS